MSIITASNSQHPRGNDTDWANELTVKSRGIGMLDEAQMQKLLSRVVESEIIPRLMLAHQNFAQPDLHALSQNNLSDEAIDRFAQLTISGEVDDLEDHIVSLTCQGVVAEAVYLELMAPAARRLGLYWQEDRCSFTDVTIGLGRLQTLLYRLSARHKGQSDPSQWTPKGLFVTPAGGQHSFGIRMVEDLFRRAGWKTLCEPNISIRELADLVENEAFDMIGIGLSIEGQIDATRAMISEVRLSSCNRQIKIMVGGSLICEQLDLVNRLGADLSAIDAREAVTIAQNIIYEQKMRH